MTDRIPLHAVREIASLHPQTGEQIVALAEQQASARRARAAETRARATRVETISVHPRVWATALQYVKGDTSRLRIVSHLRVDVLP